MIVRKSGLALLMGILFICLALFARIGERRLAADRDDWVRNDSTLTAHTIHCPEDSIQLECPPPWVKWYEVDFKDPQTGECIFKDLGLHLYPPLKDTRRYLFEPLELSVSPGDRNYLRKIIARVHHNFSFDTVSSDLFSDTHLLITITIKKNKQLARIRSHSNFLKRILNSAPEERAYELTPEHRASFREELHNLYFQKSQAGLYEEYMRSYPENPAKSWSENNWKNNCKWSKGLWATTISIHGQVDGSFPKAFQLRHAIRDRIMEYYRSLHFIEP